MNFQDFRELSLGFSGTFARTMIQGISGIYHISTIAMPYCKWIFLVTFSKMKVELSREDMKPLWDWIQTTTDINNY